MTIKSSVFVKKFCPSVYSSYQCCSTSQRSSIAHIQCSPENKYVCLSVCPSVCQYVCLSIILLQLPVLYGLTESINENKTVITKNNVCPSVRLCVCLSVRPSLCQSGCLSDRISIILLNFCVARPHLYHQQHTYNAHQITSMYVCLFVRLSVCLSAILLQLPVLFGLTKSIDDNKTELPRNLTKSL